MRILELHGREIDFSDLDKVMYPGEDVMKGDVLNYYNRVARTMLPHVRGRLMTVHRFPDGIRRIDRRRVGMPDTSPAWIRTWKVPGAEHDGRQLVVDEPAALAFLAQTACITPCTWLSRVGSPRLPDRVVFDIDPPEADPCAFDEVLGAALELRSLLEDMGLVPFVMATGSRGLHVHVPIRPELDFDLVISFARIVAEQLVDRAPTRLTTVSGGAAQSDKVLIDYMRNAYAMTAVAPYSLRALRGAPVATPLFWAEVAPGLDPRGYTMASIFARLARNGDPWKDIARHARSIRGVRTMPVVEG